MLYSEKLRFFAEKYPCETITVDGVRFRYMLSGKEN